MAKGRDRIVYQRSDGMWANQRIDATKASSLSETQAEATQDAKRMLGNQGGGEVTIQGRDGKFRNKDTVKPGHDPYPPKG